MNSDIMFNERSQTQRIYPVLFHLQEIQEQAKPTNGDRSHNGGYLSVGIGIQCTGKNLPGAVGILIWVVVTEEQTCVKIVKLYM